MLDIALVLDGHSSAALETVQSLGRLGIRTHIAAESEDVLGFSSTYPERRLRQPPALPAASFADWLRSLDTESGYRLIVPATETSLRSLLALGAGDPLRDKAILPATEDLEIALDKHQTLSLAKELGIPIPSGRVLHSEERLVPPSEFPVVLKPISSKVVVNGKLTTLAPSIVQKQGAWAAQLRRWLPYTAVLEQAYVQGTGVAVEVLYQDGELRWHFAHERLHEAPLTGGASTYRKAIQPPTGMLEASKALMDALSWHGVAMVEYKLSPDGSFTLMEVNPRLWGSLALSIDAGVDFPRGLWSLATGTRLGPQPQYRTGYTTRSFLGDTVWMRANLLASHDDPLLLTRPRVRSFVEWLKPLTGTESWDHWDRHDLRVTHRMLRTDAARYVRAVRRELWRQVAARRIRRNHARLLREAQQMSPTDNVLMVCYGNICRSPFAARLATVRLGGRPVRSAGFHQETGRPTPGPLQEVAADMGVDLSDWSSGGIDHRMVESADLILLMDLGNYEQMAHRFPEALARTTMLGLFHPSPTLTITDPYGKDEAEMRDVLIKITESVEGLERWLVNRAEVSGSSWSTSAPVSRWTHLRWSTS